MESHTQQGSKSHRKITNRKQIGYNTVRNNTTSPYKSPLSLNLKNNNIQL